MFGFHVSITHNSISITHNSKMVGPIAEKSVWFLFSVVSSSCATGTTSLVGAPFLECLFPLLPPTSGFLNKVGCLENDYQAPLEPKSKHNDRQSNSSVMVRKAPTLGELIMMSRRRSLQRKAAQMRKQNLSMVKFKPLLPICLSLTT